MKRFSETLKKLRIKNNESQRDLATILNISFQSVSKWEQGVHYPDVLMLQEIAKHYNVSTDYLLGMNEVIKEVKEFCLDVIINDVGGLAVWTDFLYCDKIAPTSVLDATRHAPGNRYLKTHPGPKDTVVLAVDKDGKICLLGEHVNNHTPTCGPEGFIYTKTGFEGVRNPCFIFEESFKPYCASKSFEFVLPKDGYLLVLPLQSIELKNLIKFIIPNRLHSKILKNNTLSFRDYYGNHLFSNILSSNELNYISVSLKDNNIIFTKEETIDESQEKEVDYTGITDFSRVKNKLDQLVDKVNFLETKVLDFEGMIVNNESEIDDVRSQIDDFASQLEDVISMIEDIEKE